MREETSSDLLKLAQSWLPILTVAAAALWTIYTYNDQQKAAALLAEKQSQREAALRLFESQRPFLDKQLELYFETAAVVGRLVTVPSTDPSWSKDANRYWALYWSELSMVEQGEVASGMAAFGATLRKYNKREVALSDLQADALRLSRAIGGSIKNRWTEQIR